MRSQANEKSHMKPVFSTICELLHCRLIVKALSDCVCTITRGDVEHSIGR